MSAPSRALPLDERKSNQGNPYQNSIAGGAVVAHSVLQVCQQSNELKYPMIGAGGDMSESLQAVRSEAVAERTVLCLQALLDACFSAPEEVLPIVERICPLLDLPADSTSEEVGLEDIGIDPVLQ